MLGSIKKIMLDELKEIDYFNEAFRKIMIEEKNISEKKGFIGKRRLQLKNKKAKQQLEKEFDDFVAKHPLYANYKFCEDIARKSEISSNQVVDVVNFATTLRDFNMTFEETVALLNAHNIPVVFDETDLTLISNEGKYDGLENFLLIHKQNRLPSGDILEARDYNLFETDEIRIANIGEVTYPIYRSTIHFSVNGEVRSHAGGGWNDCKCAILVPFSEIPKNQVKSAASQDVFIEGNLQLNETAILICPEELVTEAREKNPNIRVYGYKGSSAYGYADALTGMLGYKVQDVAMWGWKNEFDQDKYSRMIKEKTNLSTLPHSYTDSYQLEWIIKCNSRFLACLEKLYEEKRVISNEEIHALISYVLLVPIQPFDIYTFNDSDILQKFKTVFKQFVGDLQKYGINIEEVLSYIDKNEDFSANFANLINNTLYREMFMYFNKIKLDSKFIGCLNENQELDVKIFLDEIVSIISGNDNEIEMLVQLVGDKFQKEGISVKDVVLVLNDSNLPNLFKDRLIVNQILNAIDICIEKGINDDIFEQLLNGIKFDVLFEKKDAIEYLIKCLMMRQIDITDEVARFLGYVNFDKIYHYVGDELPSEYLEEKANYFLQVGFEISDLDLSVNSEQKFSEFMKKIIISKISTFMESNMKSK